VAFVSEDSTLVAGDRNRTADVLLYDTVEGTMILVSRSAAGGSANGASRSPAISADGRFVTFQSEASDLVCASRCASADEDINLLPDIFLFDRTTGVMKRISAGPAGGWMEDSVAPAISAAGDVIAFSSRRPIDRSDIDNDFDLFIHVPIPARNGVRQF
jgi:Tol biopolymer transport system component